MADKTPTPAPEPDLFSGEPLTGELSAPDSVKSVALLAAASFSASANISTDEVIAIARKFEPYLDGTDGTETEAVA